MKTCTMPMKNKPIYENSSKSDNGKVVKYTGEIWGRNFEKKKMKTYKFPSKNEYMYEVSSKSENGQI